MNKLEFFTITDKKILVKIAQSGVAAGFPSPATEYEDEPLDINDIVVSNPATTFYVRVKGNSMIDANIYDGDILVVDRSIEAIHGDTVIAIVDGDFTVKELYNKNGLVKLIPANPDFQEIELKNEQELNIWGVVSYSIHKRK